MRYLVSADMLSRNPKGLARAASATDSVELFVSEVVTDIHSTLALRLHDFTGHQASDAECSGLKVYCTRGWPKRDQLPLNMTRCWDHRGDFPICEDLLLLSGRLVVPSLLRTDIVGLLHDGHQGVNRSLALAKDFVWWPDFKSKLKTADGNCTACTSIRVMRYDPMLATKTPSMP